MSTSKDMDSAIDTSSEILKAVLGLCDKMARIEQLVAIPNVPPSTMATALMLTGITSHNRIAKMLGVRRQSLYDGDEFAAFRLAEGSIRTLGTAGRRRRSGSDFTDNDD